MSTADRIAGIERIEHLEEQLARIRITSDRHRQCAIAVRIARDLYGKSLAAKAFQAKSDVARPRALNWLID